MQIYNDKKKRVGVLKDFANRSITSTLDTGDKELAFEYPADGPMVEELREECYIRTKTDEFVLKAVERGEKKNKYTATLNVENLEGTVFPGGFETVELTITDALNFAFEGTGWKVGTCEITKRRTIRIEESTTAWAVLQQSLSTYRCECKIDSLTKTVNIYEQVGEDKGCYFMDGLNLRKLTLKSDTYDFYTRIYPIGKDGLTPFEALNVPYIENHQYSEKVKSYVWKDERYTRTTSLIEDATAKIEEMSRPYKAFTADVVDLAKRSKKYKNILSYGIGDTITLIAKKNRVKEKQRIVKITEYPEHPEKNTVEISNARKTFAEIQKSEAELSKTEAIDVSNTVTKKILENGYYTKTEVESCIAATEKKITLSVGESYITKETYADGITEVKKDATAKAEKAEAAAKADTTNRLKSYSTTEEMKAAIELVAEGITSTVSKTYVTQAIYEKGIADAKADATTKADAAAANAKADTTNRLKSYSTTLEMESKIQQAADAITSTVSKTYVTLEEYDTGIADAKNDATTKANAAAADAKADTTARLKSYSTTTEMKTAIQQAADSITSTVSSTYVTKADYDTGITDAKNDATTKANAAAKDAKADTTERLKSYSTTTQMNTAIKQAADSITSTVSKTYVTQTTYEGGIADAKNDATTKANAAAADAKADTTARLKSYSTTTEMNSAIEQAANSITLKVREKYTEKTVYEAGIADAKADATTKADAAAANAKADTTERLKSYSTTKEMNAAIKLATDAIELTIDNKIESIQVGGRNLVKNSHKLDGKWSAYGGYAADTSVVEDSDALCGYHIESSCTADGPGPHYPVFPKKTARVGKTYTWSFWAKCSSEKTGNVGHECGGYKKITVTTEWQKFSHTWTYTNGQHSSFTLYLGFKAGEVLYIRDFKIEEGTEATSWSPAPEDIDASVAAVDGKFASYSTTTQMNTAIKQAADSITSTVSKTYVTQTTYEGGIADAKNDATTKANAAAADAKADTTARLKSYSTTTQMNTAIKQAADSITSTVSKTYVTQTTYEGGIADAKADATTKANAAETNAKNDTTNRLKSYSTTTEMNTAIKQKADSIETEVSKKVNGDEIISKINQSAESVAINASKISLNGAVTANSNFKINKDGSAETKSLKITGGSLEIGGNCEITRKGDVFALSPNFVSGMYLSNEVSIGVDLSQKSYSMIMGYVGKDVFVGESASTLRGYGFTANNDIYAYGKLGCMGEKTRIIHTDDGRNAEMYAYETASPTFGDIGTGKIDNDGYCYVCLENDFLATIEKNMKYHVTLTAKGPGELYVESTNENDGYFLVKGTPKLEFYWEARVRQKGCRDTRIEESNIPEKEDITAEDQEMINEQIRNQAILLCEMEKGENEVRDEQNNLIERMEELS